MQKNKLIILFLTLFSFILMGQKCNKDILVGQWNYLINRANFNLNVDSLKKVIDTITQVQGVWTFNQNGTCDFKKKAKFINRHMAYALDKQTCEIVLFPNKKNSKKDRNLEIIYLDEKYLIYKADNNPKDCYFTYLLRRK